MAEGPRKSTRLVKLNRKAGYLYDEESLTSLSQRNNKSNVPSDSWQRRPSDSDSVRTDSESDNVLNSDNSVVRALSGWSELEKLPIYFNKYSYTTNTTISTTSSAVLTSASCSQSQSQNAPSVYNSSVQCSPPEVNTEVRRHKSSTRWDFLDLDNNYMSAASSSAFTEMSDSENNAEPTKKCGCKQNEASGCPDCSAPTEHQMANLLVTAINKIDNLTNKVKGLETRLSSLEANSDIGSDARSVRSRRDEQSSHHKKKKSSGASKN